MRSAALADIAELNPRLERGLPPSEPVAFVPMAAVSAESAAIEQVVQRPYSEVAKGYTPIRNGDLLVAKITPCFENGKIAFAALPLQVGFGSTEFHVIRARTGLADARYLLHFLRQPQVRIAGERRMTGSGGQRRVPANFLAELSVPLPSLPEQRRIADILDRAKTLRAQRRRALAQLDVLGEAIFLEMFGDPSVAVQRWPLGRIGDLLDSAAYGTSERSGPAGDFPVLRMGNITSTGALDLSELKYMDLQPHERDRYLVRKGDVLFNRTNSADLVGKTAIVRTEAPLAFAGYLIRLRVNASNDPEYLSAFLNSSYAKRMLRAMCKSIVGMANINATEIQAMQIPKPPLQIQRAFALRVEQLEAIRATHLRSLGELNTLFTSLQHLAFRGEL